MNSHHHLKSIKNEDEISFLLNKEIIMIPSSPDITFEEQKQVVDVIHKYIFKNINFLEITNKNKNILLNFLNNDIPDTFRYYNKRPIDVIENHILTIVLINDTENIGYAHIDSEKEDYWFGICILEKYQNLKFGTKIMDFIFNNEKIKKLNKIKLSVDKKNIFAIKLYHKFNFKIKEEYHETYIMEKIFI
jgi:GNAT superfamily N-acetyltransferase